MFVSAGVLLILLLCFGDITRSSPISNDEMAAEPVSSAPNTTSTTTQQPTVTALIAAANYDKIVSKTKARECTLNALQTIVLNTGKQVNEECKIILRSMIKNAGKRKEEKQTGNDADLRNELKELALKEKNFEDMNDEIAQAENLLSERRMTNIEDLQEEELKKDDSDKDGARKTGNDVNAQSNESRVTAKLDNSEIDKSDIQGGEFLIDDSGIGLLDGSNSKSKDNIDDDFLIIPLRFLRKALTKKHKAEREVEQSSQTATKEHDREPIGVNDDDVAAKWLLRSIMDMLSQDRDRKLDVSDSRNANKSGMNDETRADGDYEKEDSIKPIQELNSGILARVESDISQLGKDLRQLQFANNY